MDELFEVLVTTDKNTNISARVWNYKTGNCLHNFKSGGRIVPFGFGFIGNDYFIGAEFEKPLIKVWPVNSQEPLKNIKFVCPGNVNVLAVSPDGNYLVAGIEEQLYVWQLATGQLLAVLQQHFQKITKVLFTGCSSFLISSGNDGLVVVWSMSSIFSKEDMTGSKPKPLHVFSEHSIVVTDICVNGTGSSARLLSVSGDRTLKIHRLLSGELLLTVVLEACLTRLASHPSGASAFIGMINGNIREISFRNPPRLRMHHVDTSGNKYLIILIQKRQKI